MKPIRVLIIDDSAFMRRILTDILESDARIHVAGTARNGNDGIRKISELNPDVVTLDINMPVLDGITALERIMNTRPVPVIMLSSETGENTEHTIQAMEHGAVDFMMKPSGEISLDIEKIKEEIITKVIAAKDATLPVPRKSREGRVLQGMPSNLVNLGRKNKHTLIAIGTSTGGPRALQQVITNLPAGFKIPILIVQHMPPLFTKSLADRLNRMTELHVKEAENGEFIQPGTIYIAPGDYHMTVEQMVKTRVIRLSQDAPVNNHRPSVDTLFHSFAALRDINKIAVILTGMGSDGTAGVRKIKEHDPSSVIITESQKTAVIYGMPRAAEATGLADEILPIDQVGHYLGTLG
jgi:two-component system chemotaxis response regulator CheB